MTSNRTMTTTQATHHDQTLSRQEDYKLVTGQGHYTADVHYPGMLHAFVIRSMYAHARITRMDLSAVAAAPGVHRVITAEDVAAFGANALPNALAVKDIHGEPQKVVRMPVLAREKVHFVGQPIAMVIADSADLAQDAAELTDIEFEVLPAAADIDTALAQELPLHEGVAHNLSARFQAGDEAATDQAFQNAVHTSQLKVVSQRLIGMPMEPRAVVVAPAKGAEKIKIHTPTQGMLGMVGNIAATTGLKPDQFEVLTDDVGGSFGLRGAAYSEHVLLVLAATQLNKPVRWVGSRSEVFMSDWHGRALTLNGEVALDAQGKILGMRFKDQVDLGAFNCYMSTFIGTRNISITMGGVYKVPALYMQSDLVFTNTVPVSAYRGAGRPDIAYAVERLIDHAAHEHGFDPIELRRQNFIPPAEFPYTTANGTLYDLCECERLMDRALELSNYYSFESRKQMSESLGKLRGIGLATYLEASGAGTAPKDQVIGEFSAAGVLTVYGVTGASGQGHQTSFTQIIEKHLGLEPQSIQYRAGDPSHIMVGNGTGGSRTLYGAGSAIKNLCDQVVGKLKTLVESLWTCSADQVDFKHGVFELRITQGADSNPKFITTQDLIQQLSPEQRQQLNAVGEAQSGTTFPNGCHVAEVEIDPRTGVTEVLNYTAVDDLGNLISPQLVLGQVHGGVVQGWGQAFTEQVVYDANGQLLTGSLMDYALPRLGQLPQIHHETMTVSTELNLLGAKGVGEAGCTGSLPSLANAMMSALRPFGIQAMDMPFTSAKVWAALVQRT
ncbi:MAG: xanthine dehydrogenase family protein molybdopterin-binding subunit [Betaproteobacteria bacterium]|nr:xanthine dehydrogenase family protein molybdopterin-binding subunit [Betaproteobacteria bacterium]